MAIPDGSRDLEIEKALLMENNFEAMKSVDFNKGCYIGQVLTARMKWRALVKKKLIPVTFQGAAPSFGAILFDGEHEVGEMRSHCRNKGLALMRLEDLDKKYSFLCEGTEVFVQSVS